MKSSIKAISYAIPKYDLSNTKLSEQYPEWSVDKIFSKTGIEHRYIAAKDETALDLAEQACNNLFSDSSTAPDDIDFILYCTQSPEFPLPTTACILQNRLSLLTTVGALDFNLGCSGYVYGLGLAKGLVETGQAKCVLLVTAETYSKYINDKDKSVRTLFGDAASASIIASASCGGGIEHFVYGTDGAGANNLIVPHGGQRNPLSNDSSVECLDDSGNIRAPSNLYMNGSEIFTFTLKSVPLALNQLYDKSGLQEKDIQHFVLHQANKFMCQQLRRALKIPVEKFRESYRHFGNTVSNTIPIGLALANEENKFKVGDKIVVIGFGVGYSWGAALVTWDGFN
jgi:3-oxoacyl-[acyl-carrier-protein] synthase-3